MKNKAFVKLNSESKDINLIQDNIDKAVSPMLQDNFLGGTILTNIKLIAGQDNRINHLLQRNLLGWIITRQRSEASIYDNQDANTTKNLTLILRTTQDVIVDIRVF